MVNFLEAVTKQAQIMVRSPEIAGFIAQENGTFRSGRLYPAAPPQAAPTWSIATRNMRENKRGPYARVQRRPCQCTGYSCRWYTRVSHLNYAPINHVWTIVQANSTTW